jgi:hypothetical protein
MLSRGPAAKIILCAGAKRKAGQSLGRRVRVSIGLGRRLRKGLGPGRKPKASLSLGVNLRVVLNLGRNPQEMLSLGVKAMGVRKNPGLKVAKIQAAIKDEVKVIKNRGKNRGRLY